MADISNRFALVDREKISGHMTGIDFGNNLSCIARSPRVALFWNGGGAYWSGRGMPWAYDAAHLIAYYRSIQGQRLDYTRIGEGGRLTVKKITEHTAALMKLFDDDEAVIAQVAEAVKNRKTLLIEGGGEQFKLRK